MESTDRVLRKIHSILYITISKKHNNTLASTLGGNLKRKILCFDVYKYTSTRNNALSNNLIPEKCMDNLVSVVNENLAYKDITSLQESQRT